MYKNILCVHLCRLREWNYTSRSLCCRSFQTYYLYRESSHLRSAIWWSLFNFSIERHFAMAMWPLKPMDYFHYIYYFCRTIVTISFWKWYRLQSTSSLFYNYFVLLCYQIAFEEYQRNISRQLIACVCLQPLMVDQYWGSYAGQLGHKLYGLYYRDLTIYT